MCVKREFKSILPLNKSIQVGINTDLHTSNLKKGKSQVFPPLYAQQHCIKYRQNNELHGNLVAALSCHIFPMRTYFRQVSKFLCLKCLIPAASGTLFIAACVQNPALKECPQTASFVLPLGRYELDDQRYRSSV